MNEVVKLGVFLVITITFQNPVSLRDPAQLDSFLNLQPVNQMKALNCFPVITTPNELSSLSHGFLPHPLSIKLKVSIEALISSTRESLDFNHATCRTLMTKYKTFRSTSVFINRTTKRTGALYSRKKPFETIVRHSTLKCSPQKREVADTAVGKFFKCPS